MDILRVSGNKIIDAQDNPVQLKGTCVGGWMNMENFINGYPGAEHSLRARMADILGPAKAEFFFDRLLDYFLGEDDIAFMKECGATAVRLPFNYRHFEHDSNPFHYLETGFRRLDRAIDWCARHGLYAILDLHAVQGWQNTHWHSDNCNRHSLFWTFPHFQERFAGLWLEIAERYVGNPAVAGYNVMNEPVTNVVNGSIGSAYTPNWEVMNSVYWRVASVIRSVDPHHVIFLEGDHFSQRFAGLQAPFAADLVYSSHNYSASGFGPGAYPGIFNGQRYDRDTQLATFESSEGIQFARKHSVPLWVGEFGSVYNGPAAEIPDRLRAMDDQLSVFEQCGAHWTTWTYKDVGIMGWVTLDPDSEYMQRIAPAMRAKRELDTDSWLHWLPPSPAKQAVRSLARYSEETIQDADIDPLANNRFLAQAALDNYMGLLLQPAYAKLFKDLTEVEIDRILQSFTLAKCKKNEGLVAVLKKHMLP